jgi:hypothetical protein
MNKTLISIEELKQIALRKSTLGCEDVSAVGIYPVTDEVVEKQLVCKFRHEYNLLTG